MQKRDGPVCILIMVAVMSIVVLFVGAGHMQNSAQHKFTPEDLRAATKQAWSMCQTQHCFTNNQPNCTAFNTQMTELVRHPEIMSLDSVCELLCPTSVNCTTIESIQCRHDCVTDWSTLIDVEEHNSEDGGADEHYKGVIMVSTGASVLGSIMLTILAFAYCCPNIGRTQSRPAPQRVQSLSHVQIPEPGPDNQ